MENDDPHFNVITIGPPAAGKSGFVNAFFLALGWQWVPRADERDTSEDSNVTAQTDGLYIYDLFRRTPSNKQINVIDTKGEVFLPSDQNTMALLYKILGGTICRVPLGDIATEDLPLNSQNAADLVLITINAKILEPTSLLEKFAANWFGPATASEERLLQLIKIQQKILEFRQSIEVKFLITHMDKTSLAEDHIKEQLKKNGAENVLFAAKTCSCYQPCKHWSNKTLDGYREMIKNF